MMRHALRKYGGVRAVSVCLERGDHAVEDALDQAAEHGRRARRARMLNGPGVEFVEVDRAQLDVGSRPGPAPWRVTADPAAGSAVQARIARIVAPLDVDHITGRVCGKPAQIAPV